jgi:hypothetical protein
MSDLAEFLLARIAEDEESAREAAEAAPGRWASWNHRAHALDKRDLASSEAGRIAELPLGPDGHIARHDPARVLAECEAKRRIVDYAQMLGQFHDAETDRLKKVIASESVDTMTDVLELLALPYADHPDYRQEWKRMQPSAGRCGAEPPTIGGGAPTPCELPFGHTGWHRAGTTEWGVRP